MEENMRKIAAGMIALLAVVFGAHFALAASTPVYPTPPTTFVCVFATVAVQDDTIRCTWDSNLGAPKYSVDTVANYDLFAGGTQSVDLDFGTTTTTVDIALSSFPTDPDGDLADDTLLSVVLRVKGLNPPLKGRSQNNAFSGTVTCTILTAICA